MELPMGLILDEMSGEITGIPLVESDKQLYRIMGENGDGAGWVEIEIMVRRGVCRGEGLYREVEVGRVVSVECSGNGLYVGYEKNGENRMKVEELCEGEMEWNREGSERVMRRMSRKRRRGERE